MTGSAGTASTPEERLQQFTGRTAALPRQSTTPSSAPCPATVRTTTSQVAFRNRRGFAYVWNPRRHLKTEVPAVLSIALPRRVESSRFKEVVHPSPGVWMHHLELAPPTTSTQRSPRG